MKLAYNNWHKETVHDDAIQSELTNLTDGQLTFTNTLMFVNIAPMKDATVMAEAVGVVMGTIAISATRSSSIRDVVAVVVAVMTGNNRNDRNDRNDRGGNNNKFKKRYK